MRNICSSLAIYFFFSPFSPSLSLASLSLLNPKKNCFIHNYLLLIFTCWIEFRLSSSQLSSFCPSLFSQCCYAFHSCSTVYFECLSSSVHSKFDLFTLLKIIVVTFTVKSRKNKITSSSQKLKKKEKLSQHTKAFENSVLLTTVPGTFYIIDSLFLVFLCLLFFLLSSSSSSSSHSKHTVLSLDCLSIVVFFSNFSFSLRRLSFTQSFSPFLWLLFSCVASVQILTLIICRVLFNKTVTPNNWDMSPLFRHSSNTNSNILSQP